MEKLSCVIRACHECSEAPELQRRRSYKLHTATESVDDRGGSGGGSGEEGDVVRTLDISRRAP